MKVQKARQVPVSLRFLFALVPILMTLAGYAQEESNTRFDTRLKIFASSAFLPKDDLQRFLDNSPALDVNVDARFMWQHSRGGWSYSLESAMNYSAGDSLPFSGAPQSTLDQSPADDDARLVNLTTQVSTGEHHRAIHRFDRASISYHASNWSITAGRQALSWGSGIVFQPLDLFSPFAPTTVDRDYKAGDDMLNVEYLFNNGSDIQVVSVMRRNEQHNYQWSESSTGLKWHGFFNESELEVIVGQHYRDEVLGLSLRTPVGGALIRADVLVTHLDLGSTRVSGVVNLDYSFALKERSVYLFAEYYHNGFGTSANPVNIGELSIELTNRLQRGEVFNLHRDYLAAGVQIQWHPLMSQSVTVITNLKDTSSLLQTNFSYEPGDHQRFQLGVIAPLGASGDEFGGIAVLPGLTTGGGTRLYVRYLYFF